MISSSLFRTASPIDAGVAVGVAIGKGVQVGLGVAVGVDEGVMVRVGVAVAPNGNMPTMLQPNSEAKHIAANIHKNTLVAFKNCLPIIFEFPS